MKKQVLCLLISLSSYANLSAIKINGKDINDIITTGKSIICEVNPDSDGICFAMKDGNITIDALEITNTKKVFGICESLESNKGNLSQYKSGDVFNFSAGNFIDLGSAYIEGKNQVILSAGKKISLSDLIIKSKFIVLTCDELETNICPVSTDRLQIEAESPEAICQILQFNFTEDSKIKYIEGHVDFKNSETEKEFFVIGAHSVGMVFSSEAFDNKR